MCLRFILFLGAGDHKDDVANEAIADRRLTQSPLWQGTTALFVEDQLFDSDWRYNFNINFSHVGEANTGSSLTPEKVRKAMNFVNSSLNLYSADGRWEVGIWGRNLGDTIREQLIFDSVFQGTSRSTFTNIGRTYGMTFTANFGS